MKIKLNGEIVEAKKGETILDVAKREGVEIPYLCSHSDLCMKGSCRVCMVRVEGMGLLPACATKVKKRMEVETHSDQLEKIRRVNLELLFSQHKEECDDCVWNPGCKLLSLARKYFVKINRFTDRKDDYPELNFGDVIDFDSSKCIDCRNCIEVCPVSFLEMEGRGHKFEVDPDPGGFCVYCGQCINHCPAGSFESVGEFEDVDKPLSEERREIVFQIAPAARVSISEEFGLKPGTVSTGKLISGLKKVGADKVYDVSIGADLTTKKEAEEFLEKEKSDLPLFTSCCPSWVRFIECFHPEMVDNLTTVRSPHIILGSVIKELAKEGDEPVVVSVMPCTSKKYEIKRDELKVDGLRPVDYVLTVREVGRLFRDRGIDFRNLPDIGFDDPLGEASGDAVGYGASGGVMEAALKEAYKKKTGKRLEREDIKDREEFSFQLEGKEIKTKKVNGLKDAHTLLEEIKKNPDRYDYVEFMTCKGGCIGGGGQPVPTNKKIRKARREGLKRAGKRKADQSSFDNKSIDKFYEKIKDKDELFYTEYKTDRSTENVDTK